MSCAQVTSEDLAAWRDRALSEAARARVQAHLVEGGCDDCAELWAGVDDEALVALLARPLDQPEAVFEAVMAASAGPNADAVATLSRADADRVFAAVESRLAPPRPRRWLGPVMALAAALALLPVVLPLLEGDPSTRRTKGDARPTARLTAAVTTAVGAGARVVRRFEGAGALSAGESVIFRFDADAAAHLYLTTVEHGVPVLAWSRVLDKAAEGEVAEDGRALGVSAARLGEGARFTLWACREPTDVLDEVRAAHDCQRSVLDLRRAP